MMRERSHRQAVLTGMDRDLFLGVDLAAELAMVRQGAASYQEVGWCARGIIRQPDLEVCGRLRQASDA